MLILADFVLLVASFTSVFASKGIVSLDALLKLTPEMAFIALSPVFNLVFIAFVVNFLGLSLLLSNFLAEFQLNRDSLMSFFLLFLFLLNFLVDKRFETVELFGLAVFSYMEEKVLFSRFLKISVC